MTRDRILTILRWAFPAAIVGYLVYDVARQDSFEMIWNGGKDWTLLAVALLFFLTAQVVTIARWYWLVRALDLPFRWNDALRLGFLGYLLTFVSLGAVGGDLLKALFVAREQPGRRVEAFATVLVDRVLGLYSLLILSAAAVMISGTWQAADSSVVTVLCRTVLGTTVAATFGFGILLSLSGSQLRAFFDWLCRLPWIGGAMIPLANAAETYRRSRMTVINSVVVGVFSQGMLALCIWAIARALLPEAPGIGDHLIVVPLALLTTLLPLPGYGLGAFEFALEFLYRHVALAAPGAGLLVALGFRLIMIATAVISAVIYATNRREVGAMVLEADSEPERLPAHV